MQKGKSPGADGIPMEFWDIFAGRSESKDPDTDEPIPNPLAVCISSALLECLERGEMIPMMEEGIVSLLYKGKGKREMLGNYRPITVLSTLYKIYTKCMVIAMRDALPYLVDAEQGAFQDKYIGGQLSLRCRAAHQASRARRQASLLAAGDAARARGHCRRGGARRRPVFAAPGLRLVI